MMNKEQFRRMLEALTGAYLEDGHTENEIRELFEECMKKQLTNKTGKASMSNEAYPERVVDQEMEAYIEKAYASMKKDGNEPRKELMALPLRIMYLLHQGEYDGYLRFIEDIAYPICGVKECHYAEVKIIGRDYSKLYTGIRYLLKAYAEKWNGYQNKSISATWYSVNARLRFEFLRKVAEALYEEVQIYQSK